MKLIVAIIRPTHLEGVKDALIKTGQTGFTLVHVDGVGEEEGHTELYRGHKYPVKMHSKVQVEVAVDDPEVDGVVDAIVSSARSGSAGKAGDGRVFVLPLDRAVNMRAGDLGKLAQG